MDVAMDEFNDLDLSLAVRRLADNTEVPPIDPQREAALLAAFDQAATRGVFIQRPSRAPYWGMAALAAAAAVLIAVGIGPVRAGRHGNPSGGDQALYKPLPSSSFRGVQLEPQPPNEFVMIPGAAALPPMESGSLVRMEVSVTLLPSLGVPPPGSPQRQVKADVIVGQDGLPRAVRLVD
jgi:hypothetical protein